MKPGHLSSLPSSLMFFLCTTHHKQSQTIDDDLVWITRMRLAGNRSTSLLHVVGPYRTIDRARQTASLHSPLPPPTSYSCGRHLHVLPPFPFLEILRFAGAKPRPVVKSTYTYIHLCDIPRDIPCALVRTFNGTPTSAVHNSRVSVTALVISRYQGQIAIENTTLIKTEIPRTDLKRTRLIVGSR